MHLGYAPKPVGLFGQGGIESAVLSCPSRRSSRMENDDGFTLTEVLVALLILSFAMMALGDLSFRFVRSFRASLTDIEEAQKIQRVIRRADLPTITLGTQDTPGGRTIQIDGALFDLTFSSEDLHDNCLYDVVGRRCR